MISCLLRQARKKLWIDRRPGDDGFTLIELLVVLVILPLIIGAVAEAIIVSFQNQPSTSNRISDTTNAALTTQYFVRDVQGASEVFAPPIPSSGPQNLQGLFQGSGYSEYSPEVCGTSSSDTLLVALYRPGVNGTAPLDVAYWQHTDSSGMVEVIRSSCSLQADYSSTSPVSEVLDGPPPGSLAGGADLSKKVSDSAAVSPSQFQLSASNGWTTAAAQTVVSSEIASLSSATTIDVASTAGFAASGTLTISTSLGSETVTCTALGTSPASFTGCTNGGAGAVAVGALVTQSNISAVQLSVNEPASSYQFNVLGTPRGGSVTASAVGSGGPTLMALGSNGITLTGNGNNSCTLGSNHGKVCVNGDVVIDGSLNCGTGNLIASGTIASAASPTPTCNGAAITYTPPVADPIAPTLPGCFATSVQLQTDPPATGKGYAVPGIYTSPISGTLEPGVYVAEAGFSGSITLPTPSASDSYFKENPSHSYDPNSGILIYIPGVGPYPGGCLTVSQAAVGSAQLNFNSNSATVSVVPLDSGQSAYYFYGNTGLADMWAWQDRTNTNPVLSSKGNSTFCTGAIWNGSFPGQCAFAAAATPSVIYGLLYAPSGVVNLGGIASVASGRMIVGGLNPQNGTPPIALTGG
jgi:prepilin-type N-terminal cleavage/methylation domain-containing protein